MQLALSSGGGSYNISLQLEGNGSPRVFDYGGGGMTLAVSMKIQSYAERWEEIFGCVPIHVSSTR